MIGYLVPLAVVETFVDVDLLECIICRSDICQVFQVKQFQSQSKQMHSLSSKYSKY